MTIDEILQAIRERAVVMYQGTTRCQVLDTERGISLVLLDTITVEDGRSYYAAPFLVYARPEELTKQCLLST